MARNIYLMNMLIAFCILKTEGETIADFEKLLQDVFSYNVYNKNIRGKNDLGKPTNITVTFHLHKILKFDELLETIQFHGILLSEWIDERLVWEIRKYNGLRTVNVPADIVWKPEFGIANPSRSFRHLGGDPSRFLTRHDNGGKVLWDIGDTFECSCLVDLTSFPWDTQKCSLEIYSWGYNSDELLLSTNQTSVGLQAYETNGEWKLLSTRIITKQLPSKSIIVYEHVLQRRPVFFFVNIMLPIVTLSVLTLFVFIIPIDSGERISFSLTLLLSTVIFMTIMSTSLPPNAETMPTACYVLLFILMHSTVTFMLSIVSMHVHFKSNGDAEPGQMWKGLYNSFYMKGRCRNVTVDPEHSCITKSDKKENDLHSLDENETDAVKISNSNSMTWKNISRMIDSFFFIIMTLSLVLIYAIFAFLFVQII